MILLYASYLIYILALTGACLFVILRGGRAERRATVALLVGVLATQVAYQFGNDWRSPEYGIMAVDAVLFVAFVVIAHDSDRFWPIWIAAAQLVGTITHLAVVIYPSMATELYRSTQPFWVFPILAGIAWGTFDTMRTASKSG